MLTQVADGVWVRQSAWVWTNSIVVRGEDGLILVDPGIDGSELNQLADDSTLVIPVLPGSPPPPDHLLGMPVRDVPRYAPRRPRCGEARDGRRRWRRERVGHPLD